MKNNQMLNILSRCQKEYEQSLKNKKILFIVETKDRKLKIEEVFFGERNFYHLTGIKAFDKLNKELSPKNFYYLLSKGKINKSKIIKKDNTTDLKLQVLLQLMKIDRIANMVGDYLGNNIFLQTQKVVGNIHACMGFVRDNKLNIYVPNTVLNLDMRKLTTNSNKIIAILKTNQSDGLYDEITYLKEKYKISDILQHKYISKYIDINNLWTPDCKINKKILDFHDTSCFSKSEKMQSEKTLKNLQK